MTRGLSADEADRRMRLLEMAGGDLRKARELEQWVLTGATMHVVIGQQTVQNTEPLPSQEPDDFEIPVFLRRSPAP